jgi:putative transposase
MGTLDYKQFTERHRPHINPPDATFFVTCRLAGSIPKQVVEDYKRKKHWLDSQLKQALQTIEILPSPEVENWVSRIEHYQREWFIRYEEILHKAQTGPVWMKNPEIARMVAGNLHRLDGEVLLLDAYSVMSNHIHIVFKPFLSGSSFGLQSFEPVNAEPGLARIMHSIKGRSARECNLLLGRTGSFWEHESFDHVIREGRFGQTIRYVLNNPVKAGLVRHWKDWPWNYCRKELQECFAPQ